MSQPAAPQNGAPPVEIPDDRAPETEIDPADAATSAAATRAWALFCAVLGVAGAGWLIHQKPQLFGTVVMSGVVSLGLMACMLFRRSPVSIEVPPGLIFVCTFAELAAQRRQPPPDLEAGEIAPRASNPGEAPHGMCIKLDIEEERNFVPNRPIPGQAPHGMVIKLALEEERASAKRAPARSPAPAPPRSESRASTEAEGCACCLSEYEQDTKVAVLPCSHTFCAECIEQWAGKGNVKGCPMCRTPFSMGKEPTEAGN